MNGWTALVASQLREIVRTWRIWVLPSVLVVLAATGPVLARFTKELLDATLGAQAGAIPIPDPTYLDAYAQWTKNLTQLVPFVLVVITAGAISGQVRNGTAVLLLTKPVSRPAFVLAPLVSTLALVIGATVAASALTWGVTRAVFGTAPAGPLTAAVGAWLVVAFLVVAVSLLASALTDAQAGASGIGIGAWLLLAVLSAWPAAARYSPAGALGLPAQLGAGQHPAVLWPLATTGLAALLAVAAAVLVFERREL
jgi:ABC-2 type transport system permease protein